jgi:uncharacterized protein (AIM24 family)
MSAEEALKEYSETETSETFSKQNSKLLRVELTGATVQAKLGSMVAYNGEVKFEHAGHGGLGRMVKKAVSGEGTELMKISGSGEVYLADQAQDIHLIQLESDRVTCNGANLLAFDSAIDWDISKVEGLGGMMAGGMFNVELSGTGWVALLSDGPPLLLTMDGQETFADPQAAITWSSGVRSDIKTDVNLKSFLGRGSGEELQIAFTGTGWLLIQPSEGRVKGAAAPAQGGASQQKPLGGMGGLLGR